MVADSQATTQAENLDHQTTDGDLMQGENAAVAHEASEETHAEEAHFEHEISLAAEPILIWGRYR